LYFSTKLVFLYRLINFSLQNIARYSSFAKMFSRSIFYRYTLYIQLQ